MHREVIDVELRLIAEGAMYRFEVVRCTEYERGKRRLEWRAAGDLSPQALRRAPVCIRPRFGMVRTDVCSTWTVLRVWYQRYAKA